MDKYGGLDVYKDNIFAWILDTQAKKILENRYGTLMSERTDMSLRKMIKAIIGGERDPVILSRFVHGRRNAHPRYGTNRFVGKTAGALPYSFKRTCG
ncbi:MAG: hypothetical protein LBS03_00900 [Bacteroidales bacterium]|jgi:hypothetical protein|nr:hypothetical protein [Bacteroidales bacterium]